MTDLVGMEVVLGGVGELGLLLLDRRRSRRHRRLLSLFRFGHRLYAVHTLRLGGGS